MCIIEHEPNGFFLYASETRDKLLLSAESPAISRTDVFPFLWLNSDNKGWLCAFCLSLDVSLPGF